MRITCLVLALFCAPISGWTAALAQIQTMGNATPAHHAQASLHDHMSRDQSGHDHSELAATSHCPMAEKACAHPGHTVHPLLCAACFAVSVKTFDMKRDEPQTVSLRPQPQRPMRASALKPRFPPPKASTPTS